MPPQKYRLQALLNLKARLKKKAELVLAKALIALKEAKERLEELEKEKEKIIERWKQARAEMKRKEKAGLIVKESNVHVNFLRKLKEDEEEKQMEIEDQEQVVEDCETAVAAARREYIDAARELQVMEKHKELWQKKVSQEISRKEQKEMDELGGTIHQLRRWRGEKSLFEV
ncbi:MAG: flagellar FliJ family protein [Pseudomonadota bacterium]